MVILGCKQISSNSLKNEITDKESQINNVYLFKRVQRKGRCYTVTIA